MIQKWILRLPFRASRAWQTMTTLGKRLTDISDEVSTAPNGLTDNEISRLTTLLEERAMNMAKIGARSTSIAYEDFKRDELKKHHRIPDSLPRKLIDHFVSEDIEISFAVSLWCEQRCERCGQHRGVLIKWK
jgi:hypothetical protein